MSSEQRSRRLASFRRVVLGLGSAALMLLLGPPPASADFVSPYAIGDFTVVNSTFSNGSLQTPDNGRSVVLTGPNDGSGLAGQIDATVICRGAGVIRFHYAFATSDAAGFDSAGYLLNGQFHLLANAPNASGMLSVTVGAGDVFGFRVSSSDNTGEPGILTVSEVSFPPSTTITSINAAPNPSVSGQTVTLIATVASVAGTPGGSVTFKEGTATLGAAPLNNLGQAQLVTSAFRVGDHAITAFYGGNDAFAPSASLSVTQVVRAASTVTTLSSSSQVSVFGQLVTLTASVATVFPGSGVPTGSVSFADAGTPLGTAVLSGDGTARLTVSSLSIGAHTLTAAYGSDGAYRASASATLTQTVNPAATRTGLSSSSVTVTKGQSVTFTATVSVVAPGAGTPTGAVAFREGGTTLGVGSLDSALRATFTTDSLSAGLHSITAVYSGDSNFTGSTSVSVSETVNKAPTAVSVQPLAGPVLAGGCVTLTAAVTSAAGIPTGTIAFRNSGAVLATAPVNGFGTASAANVCLGVGSYFITADYSGDANFLNSSSPGTPFSVNPIPTQVSAPVLRSGSPLAGETLTLEANVTGEHSPMGVVRFFDGYTSLGTAAVDRQGVAILTTRLGIGAHVVTAFYEGDVMHATARSEPLFLTIRGVAAVKVDSSANPSRSGAAVVFTATVTGPQGSIEPAGSVTFLDGTRSLGTSTLTAGQASIKVTDLSAGEHTIVGSYSGDANFVAALSPTFRQLIARVSSTTTVDAGVDSEGYFLTAKVACSTGSEPGVTGAVQFEDVSRNSVMGSVALIGGSATMRLGSPVPVGHRLRAVYTGDGACDGSESAVLPLIAAANAFSFSSAAFAADTITSIFGENLTPNTARAPSGVPTGELGGLTVEIIDIAGRRHPAGLYFVSPSQVNFVLPAAVPAGPARAVVTGAGTNVGLGLVVSRVAPGLASLNGSGSGPAAAYLVRVHQDGSQDQPIVVSAAPEAFGNETDRMYVALYGTGFRNKTGSTTCTLNDQLVSPLYIGPHPAYSGLDQINIEIPAELRGAGVIGVRCTVEGQTSNSVSINVR